MSPFAGKDRKGNVKSSIFEGYASYQVHTLRVQRQLFVYQPSSHLPPPLNIALQNLFFIVLSQTREGDFGRFSLFFSSSLPASLACLVCTASEHEVCTSKT